VHLVKCAGGGFDPFEGNGCGSSFQFGDQIDIANHLRRSCLEQQQVFQQRRQGAEQILRFLLAFCTGAVGFRHLEESRVIRIVYGIPQNDERVLACGGESGKIKVEGTAGGSLCQAGDKLALGDPKGVVLVVLNGRGGMPAFKDSLADQDLAAILSYVRAAWGNKARPVGPETLAAARTGAFSPQAPLQAH